MKPEKLILRDFIPTKIGSGIKEIIFEPRQDLQLIIGDNGSGKSALLSAFSLSPLDRKLFDENGYRELILNDNGITYRLVSDYSHKTPKHEFWEEDVNLNPGGTGAVQNDLVIAKFNYTKFIHSILSSKTSFCQMSPKAAKTFWS
ncbi:SbcC-like protein [Vibrio phage BONAISHI]|nr:SbcC-like protein [Vibrio phage BONAISHI]